MDPTTFSRACFDVAAGGRPRRGGGGPGRHGRGARRARVFPRAGHPSVHQRGGHLYGDDRLAHAGRSGRRHRIRVEALRDARRASGQGGSAHRHARAQRSGDGHVGRGVGIDARHGSRPHGHRSAENGRPARPGHDEERGHHPEIPPLRLRPCRPQLRRAPRRSGKPGGPRARGQPEDGDDALLQQQQ